MPAKIDLDDDYIEYPEELLAEDQGLEAPEVEELRYAVDLPGLLTQVLEKFRYDPRLDAFGALPSKKKLRGVLKRASKLRGAEYEGYSWFCQTEPSRWANRPAEKPNAQRFGSELGDFCNALLKAMDALPTPPRKELSSEDLNRLHAQFLAVHNSFDLAKDLFLIACHGLARTNNKPYPFQGKVKLKDENDEDVEDEDGKAIEIKNPYSRFVDFYIADQRGPWRKYENLRMFFWRQRDEYKAKRKEYNARADVKKREKKRNKERVIDKLKEAERKRTAYWAAKGQEPPPKRARVNKMDVAIEAQAVADNIIPPLEDQ